LRFESLEQRDLPATFVPTTFADGETIDGTLRAAVIAANRDGEDNVISLRAGIYSLAVQNTAGQENYAAQGDLDVTSNGHTLNIEGQGVDVTVIDGSALNDRLFQVSPGVTVVFRNLTLRGGHAQDDGGAGALVGQRNAYGGGILNAGTLKLEDVVLERCTAQGIDGAAGTADSPSGGTGASAFGGGISSSGRVELLRSTVRRNFANGRRGGSGTALGNGGDGGDGGNAAGGGLHLAGGTALLVSSTVALNYAFGGDGGFAEGKSGHYGGYAGSVNGGGLDADGELTLVNTTVSSNTAEGGQGGYGTSQGLGEHGGDARGGGIFGIEAQLKLENSTVARNSSYGGPGGVGDSADAPKNGAAEGGGVFAIGFRGSARISVSSLIASNTATDGPDFFGAFDMVEHTLVGSGQGATGILDGVNGNLVGVSALLGPLADNGGPTWTHALLPGSPAIDAGANPDGLDGDQRGFGPRAANGAADIGAFETAAKPVITPPPPTDDFGDAPAPYPTLLANDGARHHIVPGFYLGSSVDAEADGQPRAFAAGDDLAGSANDDDGVVFTTALQAGQQASVTVTASRPGLLQAWVDFNNDGDWNDAGEQVFTNQLLAAGTNALTFTVPAAAVPSASTCARFRFSTQADLRPTGPAPDGEVEDDAVSIIAAPPTARPTNPPATPPAVQPASPLVLQVRGGRRVSLPVGSTRGFRLFRQRVVLTNSNGQTLKGQYHLALDGLTDGMSVVRVQGLGKQVKRHDSHSVLLDFGARGLAPGAELTLVLTFRKAAGIDNWLGVVPLTR
jgi:hypothetical protein